MKAHNINILYYYYYYHYWKNRAAENVGEDTCNLATVIHPSLILFLIRFIVS